MRGNAALTASVAVALLALPVLVQAADAQPEDVRSLATRGWAGSGDETLEAVLPLFSGYAFLFSVYCDDAAKVDPYAARIDGPGVRDILTPGIAVGRELEAGPYRLSVDAFGDTSGCAWSLFIDSESSEDLESLRSVEEFYVSIRESSARLETADPWKCSGRSGSVMFVQGDEVGSLDSRWTCDEHETAAEEEAQLAREQADSTTDPEPTPGADLDAGTPGLTIVYEIQEGEALLTVADTFGVTRRSILRANPGLEEVSPADLPGETIEIPVPADVSLDELEVLPGYRGPAPFPEPTGSPTP